MRRWLRIWLTLDLRTAIAQLILQASKLETRIDALEALQKDSLSKSNDLQAALQEIRQIRETVLDPKKVPIATRNSRQFRALVEQDAG